MPGSDRPNVFKGRSKRAWSIANNTGLDEADVEPGDLRTRLLPKRNRSLVTPPVKFRILKIHAAETRRGKRPPRWEAPDFPRQRPAHCPLTLGNVGGSPTPGNHTAETALAGWGGRIRTSEWRNQNPQEAFDMQRLSGLMLHLCLMRQGVLAVPPPILAMIPSAPFVRR